MESKKRYSIPFTGLSEGSHHFDYPLDGTFFSAFGNEELSDSSINMKLELIKEVSFMELHLSFSGRCNLACDRCLGDLEILIEGDRMLVAKTSEDMDDEEVLALSPQDTELNLGRTFYETVVIALPLKRAHDIADCDPDVLDRLEDFEPKAEEGTDPRWDALKKLK